MGITVHWDNDSKTILHLDFKIGWNWAIFADALARTARIASQNNHAIDLIFSMTDNHATPDEAALHMRAALGRQPQNVRHIAIVTNSHNIENCVLLLRRVYHEIGSRVITVPTLDAARAALEHPYTLKLSVSPAAVSTSRAP